VKTILDCLVSRKFLICLKRCSLELAFQDRFSSKTTQNLNLFYSVYSFTTNVKRNIRETFTYRIGTVDHKFSFWYVETQFVQIKPSVNHICRSFQFQECIKMTKDLFNVSLFSCPLSFTVVLNRHWLWKLYLFQYEPRWGVFIQYEQHLVFKCSTMEH